MTYKLPRTKLERFLRQYCALIVPNWSKWQYLNPHNLTKNDHGQNISSNLSSGQQKFLNDIKNGVTNV